MREILFKAKRVDNGKWVYGDLVRIPNGDSFEYYIISDFDDMDGIYDVGKYAIKVIPETVSEFCGLTDKNNKKIFEGDIVKTKYGRLCVVEWRSTPCFCGFDLMVYVNWDDLGKAPSSWDLYMPQNLEIVGNIYDNPNLLNKE